MTIPNLLHPVPIYIQQIDTDNTLYDDEFREFIGQETLTEAVMVPGQVKQTFDYSVKSARRGRKEDSSGYILFRYVDLNAAGITLALNDRISKIGTIDTDVYINVLEPEGHYEAIGGPTVVKAYFTDKQPVRQTRGT
jgi:hypothetical protein